MLLEPFAAGDSFLHRLDPRIRLVTAAVYSCAVAVCRAFPALSTALLLSMALIALARLRITDVFKRLLVVNGLVAFIWAVIPFTFPGEALFRLGPFSAAKDGVELAAQITLKSNAIVLAFMALVATMPLATALSFSVKSCVSKPIESPLLGFRMLSKSASFGNLLPISLRPGPTSTPLPEAVWQVMQVLSVRS